MDELGDTLLIITVGSCFALLAWVLWYLRLFLVSKHARNREGRRLLAVVPFLSACFIWLVLRNLASNDVQDSLLYCYSYSVIGCLWTFAWVRASALMNVSMVHDALERGNFAAACVVAGFFLGLAACYAGGNIGDGPGTSVVIAAALLSSITLLLLWLPMELVLSMSERITVERDVSAGIRLGVFLMCEGILCGRAVAGDWDGVDGLFRDFADHLLAMIALLAVALLVEYKARVRDRAPTFDPALIFPIICYALFTLGYLLRVGVET